METQQAHPTSIPRRRVPAYRGRTGFRFPEMVARDHGSHFRPVLAAFNFQPASDIFHSLFHSCDSYTRPFAQRRPLEHSAWYASPLVTDRNCQPLGDALDLDRGSPASRVEVNIRKAGLHNPKDRELRLFA